MNTTAAQIPAEGSAEYAIQTEMLNLWYGTFQALFDVDLKIRNGMITSLIGPSGCGKSTFLRSVNRINERLGYVRIEGTIRVQERNIYDPDVELVQVRKQIGMVFQRPCRYPSGTTSCSAIDSTTRTSATAAANRRRSSRAPCAKCSCGTRSKTY